MTTHLHLLGSPQVVLPDGSDAGLPLGKPLAALCYVALESTRVTRDDLAAVLWSGAPESRARQSVRQALWMLRKAAGDDIVVEVDGVLLVGPEVDTDLDALAEALASGNLERAWELWQGGPLQRLAVPDSPAFQGWADEVRSRWEMRLGEALLARAEAENDPGVRVSWLIRALRVQPYSEPLHRARIRALLEQRDIEGAEEALNQARAVVDEPTPGLFDELSQRLRALRRTRFAGQSDDEGRLVPEFVGRAEEFSRVATLWRSALSGRPRTAALVGPMGIGKTRLAEEFLALAESDGARIAVVKAVETERTLELGVAGTLVRDLLKMPGGAGISAASAQTLQHLVPSSGNGVAPQGTAPNPAGLADAVEDLIEAIAHEVPLVLLVDDLQWVDLVSRTLFLRLARTLRNARALMVFTSRTEEGDAGALRALRALEEQRKAAVIEVEPLTESEVTEMVWLLLEDPVEERAEGLARQIIGISSGTPLVVVELLRVLADEGILVPESGVWSLAGKVELGQLRLPATLTELFESRLAGLPETHLRILMLLAHSAHPVSPANAVAQTGLPEPAVQAAAKHLAMRGLLRWSRTGDMALAHDSLRASIPTRHEDPAPRSPHPVPPGPEAAGRAQHTGWLLPLLALGFIGVLLSLNTGAPPSGGAEAGPFGLEPPGGLLRIELSDGRLAHLRFQSGGTLEERVYMPPPSLTGQEAYVRVKPTGETEWLSHVGSQQEGPDVIALSVGSTPQVVLGGDGDQVIAEAWWSDRWALVNAQDSTAGWFRRDLVLVDRVLGTTRTLLRPGYSAGATLAPDQRRLLVMSKALAGPDSLRVITPTGRILAAQPLERNLYNRFRWCGVDYLAFQVAPRRRVAPVIMEPETGAVTPLDLPPSAVETGVDCSPDGRYLSTLNPSGDSLLILERATLETVWRHPLPAEGTRMMWLPSDGARLPFRLEITDSVRSLEWGGRTHIRARAILEDGTPDTSGVALRSLDPEVIRVVADSIVGIRPGEARVEVSARDWVLDTITVRVTGQVNGTALLTDPLEFLDPKIWPFVLGDGFARPVVLDGERVLEVGSDPLARWTDGWVSRDLPRSPEGLTVEFDFRLALTRTDKQSVELAISDASPPVGDLDPTWSPHWVRGSEVRFRYPAGELGSFDPEMGMVMVDGSMIPRLPLPSFPKRLDAWTRVALQIAPDGMVSIFIDGQHAPMEPLRTDVLGTRPRLLLIARDADTQLYVRDLVVWPGVRFETETVRQDP